MKKLLCFLLATALLGTGLCGCNAEEKKRQERIDAYLQEGKYQEAYDEAEGSKEKNKVLAENFLAYVCRDIAVNASPKWTLDSGSFGQAKAKETDAYTPNDPMFTIANFAKLAEYVSLMSGRDAFGEYYYAVFKVTNDSSTLYGLASVKIENNEYELIDVWDSFEQTADDGNVVALYKYIARQIQEDGTSLDNNAVKRINEKYLTDSPESVEFELALD